MEKLDSQTLSHLANAPMLDISVGLERLGVMAPDSIWELSFTFGVERVNKIMSNCKIMFKKGKKALIYSCSPLLLDICCLWGWVEVAAPDSACEKGLHHWHGESEPS